MIWSEVVPPAGGAGNLSQITLPEAWAADNDVYNGRTIEILSGPAAGDSRTIFDYDGAARTAIVDSPFSAQINEGTAVKLVSKTVDALLDLMQADADQQLASPHGSIFNNVSNAKSRGLDIVVYEGGTHTNAALSYPDVDPANEMLNIVNRHARMKEIVVSSLSKWKDLRLDSNGHGPKVWCAFQAISRWSHWGRWGHLEHVYQDPATAPRWQGLMQFIAENPAWWRMQPGT